MRSSQIGQVAKAHRYAEERGRVRIEVFRCRVRGDNDAHEVRLAEGDLHCDCHYFRAHRICSHAMALQQLFGELLPEAPRPSRPSAQR